MKRIQLGSKSSEETSLASLPVTRESLSFLDGMVRTPIEPTVPCYFRTCCSTDARGVLD